MKATTRQSLEKVLAYYDAGKLGAMDDDGKCMYYRDGRYCAIGCLLPEHVLLHLKESYQLMDLGARTLFKKFPGLEDELGMTDIQADIFQILHDNTFAGSNPPFDYRAALERLLAGQDVGGLCLDEGC